MEITRQADYAVRAVLHVSRLPEGQRAPTSIIAEKQNIPLPFLAKIISQLAVAGLVDAMRGASGGVCLARPATEITCSGRSENRTKEIAPPTIQVLFGKF